MNERVERVYEIIKEVFEPVRQVNNWGLYYDCLRYDYDCDGYVYNIYILDEDVSVAMDEKLRKFSIDTEYIDGKNVRIVVANDIQNKRWTIQIVSSDLLVIPMAVKAEVVPLLEELNELYTEMVEGGNYES